MVLLIGGHMRSGTTLLMRLCDGHPDIAVTPEFRYLHCLGKNYSQHCRLLLKRLWYKTIRGQSRWTFLQNASFIARYLFEMRKYIGKPTGLKEVESTLRSIFPEARIVGDKMPLYALQLDRFAPVNGLRRLIIYRDCRDVVSSTLLAYRTGWHKMSWAKTVSSAEKIALLWVRYIELMERHMEKLYTIRYEDLVRDPAPVLQALGGWLGVDPAGFPEDMVHPASIGKYKTGLTQEELETVMEIAGPTMARLGYL